MARKRSTGLTEVEHGVMEVIWRLKEATVGEVVRALAKKPAPAYNTVLTTMTILERKGYLRHAPPKEGRAFVYSAAVTKGQASRNAVGHLLDRFFGSSAEALVLNLIEDETLSGPEIKRLRKLLNEEAE